MKINQFTTVAIYLGLSLFFAGCGTSVKDYPIQPVPFTDVKLTDEFWAPKIKVNHEVTIPIALKHCETTGRIRNFKIAGKLESGSFCTQYPFDDSDIYKIIEGASFSLQTFPDKNLESYLDTLIKYLALAQEPDGYLYTNRTINPDSTHVWAGNQRWANDSALSHELYNLGHLYEAAVAHYAATGKRNLLDIAIKSANQVDNEFGPGKLSYYPGHQVIEMGLASLFRTTNDERYLKLAKFFLDIRGPHGQEYCQAHKRVFDQDKIVGHAVRATYMYSGMADVAAMMNDHSYSKPLFSIWDDLIRTKYYITGGIGSSGSNEGFGDPYDLPNMSAYCETCASIGLVYWNYRMFLLTGDSKFYDVLERTLYNALLSGVSISGDRFFYPNVLESRGQHTRSEWFGCACCPGNICRFIPSIPGYIYAVKKDELYTNLYVNSTANITLGGLKAEIEQITNFPTDGKVEIIVRPEKETKFSLKLRIPSWVNGQAVSTDLYRFTKKNNAKIKVLLNGEMQDTEVVDGYVTLNRKWKLNDRVELELPMEVRLIVSNPKIKGNVGKASLQRGSFVYCLEWPDNVENIHSLVIDTTAGFKTEYRKDLLNGISVINGLAKPTAFVDGKIEMKESVEFTAIPYYSWANRGAGDMAVWMAVNPEKSRPKPAPTIASRSQIFAMSPNKSLFCINDQEVPDSSNDRSVLYLHWWPMKDTVVWLEYKFDKAETISESSVFWYDDGPFGGCRVPSEWKILYNQNNKWKAVKNTEEYLIAKNIINTVRFQAVKTTGIRIEITLPKDWSSGLYEWNVK
jgi:uncharacterized protein